MDSENLKKKTAVSLIWNIINKAGYQVIAFLVAIITTRILTPEDFGYIAALAIFSIVSGVLIESGFSIALVRRENNTRADYSAAFYFNVLLSIILYLILFFCAPLIADFFNMPPLVNLARVIFLALVINSFVIVPNVILTKQLKFKQIAIADLGGMIISSVITIVLAIKGFGYWAIAAQQVSQVFFKMIIIWCCSKWWPSWKSNFALIKELFAFSFAIIISSLLNYLSKYVYNFVIGRTYSTADLGYYGQANKYYQIPVNVIINSVVGVAYPVFSSLNNDKERQVAYINKIIAFLSFFSFPVLLGFFAVAPNFITVVITDKWMPILPYLRLFLISSLIQPFIILNINIFNVKGKSRYYLYVEILMVALTAIFLLFMHDTIMQMIIGFLLTNLIVWVVTLFIVKHCVGISCLSQIVKMLPSLLISIIMAGGVMLFDYLVPITPIYKLCCELIIGVVLYILLALISKNQIFIEIFNQILNKIKNK